MSNNIILKKSSIGDRVPAPGDLQHGELALNFTDGNLFYKNSSNVISTIASNKFVSVSGNVTAGGYFIGDGSQLTGVTSVANAALVVGNTLSSNVVNSSLTSVGTLSSLSVTGNINTTGQISATGNTTSGNFVGTLNGSGANVTSINATNISSGTLAQARLANVAVTLGNTTLTLGSTTTSVAGLSSVTSTTFVGALTGAATTAGTVTTAAQPNITSVGTLSSLSVSGNVTAGGYFIGDGSQLTGVTSVANAALVVGNTLSSNVVNSSLTSVGTLSSLSVTGNVTAGNLTTSGAVTGNGRALTSLNASNMDTGTLPSGRLTGTYTITVSGSATTAGTVTTAAQPNITSVGTLTALAVTGNTTSGNFVGTLNGSGANVTSINATNISSGTLAQARLANAAVTLGSTALTLGATVTTVAGLSSVTSTTFVGALTGAATTAGTVTTAAQPNITSVGTLSSLSVTGNVTGGNLTTSGAMIATGNVTGGNLLINNNAVITGNLTVQGTETIFNVNTLTVNDKDIVVANNVTGGANVNGAGILAGNPTVASWLFNNATTSWQSNIGITPSANGTLDFGGTSNRWKDAYVISLNATGNANVGNLDATSGVFTGAISVTGNVTGGNLVTSGAVTGNGRALTSLNASNMDTGTLPAARLSGTYTITVSGAATTAGTVTTAAQPNITSVGTLSSLAVTGNVTGANFIGTLNGSGANVTAINATNISSGTLAQARLANAAVTLGSTALTLGSTVTTVAGLSSVTSTTFVGALTGTATTANTLTTARTLTVGSTGKTFNGSANVAWSLAEIGAQAAGNYVTTDTTQTITGTKTIQSSLLYLSPNQANTISSNMLNGGTLSFEGNAGQLLSITDSMSGTIFSVNDISGIPSIEVLDSGLIKLAEYSGNVLIGTGTDNDTDKLQINGSVSTTRLTSTVTTGTAPLVVASTTRVSNLNVATAGTADTLTTTRTLWGQNFNGSTNVTGNLTSVGNITGTGAVTLTATGGTLALAATGANIVTASTNGSERLRIDSSGNVGIGTSGPVSRLHVRQDQDGVTRTIIQNRNGTGTPISELTFITGSFDLADSRNAYIQSAGTSSPYIAFGTSNGAAPTEKMRITSTGNVGIGASTPSAKLQVDAPSTTDVSLTWGAAAGQIFRNENSELAIGLENTSPFGLYLQARTNTNGTRQLLINPLGGNVGVGTQNPQYALEVNGSFAATTKSFLIDHPTKEGMKLRYGSLEGPENGVYIRGRLTGCVIELPEYWTKLVDPDSITVQLTPIGKPQKLYIEDIRDNKIYISSDAVERIDCFYLVLAERVDVEKLQVEI